MLTRVSQRQVKQQIPSQFHHYLCVIHHNSLLYQAALLALAKDAKYAAKKESHVKSRVNKKERMDYNTWLRNLYQSHCLELLLYNFQKINKIETEPKGLEWEDLIGMVSA